MKNLSRLLSRKPIGSRLALRQSLARPSLLSLLVLLVAISGGLARATPVVPAQPERVRIDHGPPYSSVGAPALQAIQGTEYAFRPTADAEIREGAPSQHFGISTDLSAGYDGYPAGDPNNALRQRALLRFDIAALLPKGTVIHSALFQIAQIGSCDVPGTTRPITIGRISAPWSERGVTWNNQPASVQQDGTFGVSTFPPDPQHPPIWYSVDIMALVRGWVDRSVPDYGLMLRGVEEPLAACSSRIFLSKAGSFLYAPKLLIDYSLPEPALSVSQPSLTFVQPCDAAAPAARTVDLLSNSTAVNAWNASVSGGDGWLTLSSTAGKLSAIFPDQISFQVNPAMPCPGTLAAQVQISADGLGPPQTISVTLVRTTQPLRYVFVPWILKGAPAVVAGTPAPAQDENNKFALIIGIADYQNLGPPTIFSTYRSGEYGTDVFAPWSDAPAVQDTLFGNGYTTFMLLDSNATKAQIELGLERIRKRARPGAHILFYFSGHGAQTTDIAPIDEPGDHLDELIAPYDVNLNTTFEKHISDDELDDLLDQFSDANVGVILDSCNSGGMELSHPNRSVLTASTESQLSWETDELEHGVATSFMLTAMHDPATDTNQNGAISVREIYDAIHVDVAQYVHDHIPKQPVQTMTLSYTKEFDVVQTPSEPLR